MKTIKKKQIKGCALFLLLLMLIQSCTVYKSTSVTLGEAVEADTRVKIKKRNGEKLKYYRINQGKDGNYYGDIKVKRVHHNVLINEDEIQKIQIKDKTTSTILTVAIPVAYIGLALVLLVEVGKGVESIVTGR